MSVEIPGQLPRYERSNKGHHHHFVCRCGGVFELARCLAGVKDGAPRFRVEDHEIILYGTCEACLRRENSKSVKRTGDASSVA